MPVLYYGPIQKAVHYLKYYPLVQNKNIAFRTNNLKENQNVSPPEGKMWLAMLFI